MSSGPAALLRQTPVTHLGQSFGTLETTRVLGVGGQATVYCAYCTVSRQQFAVKVLERDNHIGRFSGEYRALRLIDSPHVVAVHSYGIFPVPHFVMDYLPGESLEDHVRRRGSLPAFEAIELVRQVCAGLEALHAAGVVHRDLKLKNVIRSPTGHITLVDLGIARKLPRFYDRLGSVTDPALRIVTTSNANLGTPGFMAPEVCAGRAASEQADIFALGAILHVLVTGKTLDISGELDRSIESRVRKFIADATNTQRSIRYANARIVSGVLGDLSLALDPSVTDREPPRVSPPSEKNRFPWGTTGFLIGFFFPFFVLIFRTDPGAVASQPLPLRTTHSETRAPTLHPVAPATNSTSIDAPFMQATVGAITTEPTGPTKPPATTEPTEPPATIGATKPIAQARGPKKNTALNREFRTALKRLLRMCVVPPQTIRYRVGRGRVRLKFASPVGDRSERCLLDSLPRDGRFRGVMKPGGKR